MQPLAPNGAKRHPSFIARTSGIRFLIPEGARVLEIGCGTGDTLAALKPSYGLASTSVPG
jgi:ubiquinone/menaquinone biosynthesis C-methylase UbiE